MAIRTATANGNWSDVAIWDGGATIPATGDEVRSNGYTVVIDVTLAAYTFTEINNIGGGGFTINIAATIKANIASRVATTCLTNLNDNTRILKLYGDIIANAGAGLISNSVAFINSSTGNVDITGNVIGYNQTSRNNNDGIRNDGTGTINLTGNVTVAGSGGGTVGCGIKNSSTGTINITGNVTGGANAGWAVWNNSTGTINITGIVTGGSHLAGYGVQNTSTGPINITGTAKSDIGYAVYSTSLGYVTVIGTIDTNTPPATVVQAIVLTTGTLFVSGTIKNRSSLLAILVAQISPINANSLQWDFINEVAGTKSLYTADLPNLGNPSTLAVRDGTTYGPAGQLTGKLKVPNPSDVLQDVPTDNTVGTLIMTPDGFWGYDKASLTTSGSIGAYLKDAATVASTGDQLVNLI